ncbi:uncharacterized protein BX663DRAFT_454178 [Cokeromyces recurvatus]|uniref:uncharacterized protein n=1 Tax=Cokeromyces recurvatus TaxID=90255 RepID=UPI002220580C|nr:uncharacterized protein BX663DRAFT_454178 [Cokeromyces recurvatus]KAI7902927.1 hypothetical protein BX663DRAFT_454178 [Cokeromyces recurvatus]
MFKRAFIQISRYSTKAFLPSSIITPPIETRLKALSDRHDTLLCQLNNINLSPAELTSASKELAKLTTSKALFDEWLKHRQDLAELQNLSEDPELAKLAQEESNDITQALQQVEKNLLEELAPKDAADNAISAILEIRAGAGGDEASLFVADLSRMYERFAQLQRWKWEIISSSEEAKGLKDLTVSIGGRNVFTFLKYESGVHRVQRVPATETQGRIHTSTVTVAILPEPNSVDIDIKDSDLRIDVYRSSGAGGQHVNTTDSAVRITHLPTGITIAMQDERSQHKNKLKALKVLRAKIFEQERQRVDMERRQSRNKQIGSGDRSEKIRTYNYPQNRVTDHRINLTLYELEQIVSGEGLMHVIEPLQKYYLMESILLDE